MRQLIGWLLGLAAVVAGFIFSGFIIAGLLFLIVFMLTLMLLRRLWFKLTGRQPTPFFVFRHQRHGPVNPPYQAADDHPQGRTIDAAVEPDDNNEQRPRLGG